MSEDARKLILQMLAEGKISVDESERLLAALKDGNTQTSSSRPKTSKERFEEREREREEARERDKESDEKKSEGFNPFNDDFFNPFGTAGKIGFDLKNLAQNLQHTVHEAVKKAEPRSKELKEKMKEFGAWMQDLAGTMASELVSSKSGPADGAAVDFMVSPPAGIDDCDTFNIENVFGEIRIHEGEEFKLHVTGRISAEAMGESQPSHWFFTNGIHLDEKVLNITFDPEQSHKALMDMEITIPAGKTLKCRTLSGMIRIRGNHLINSIKTVSGNVKIQDANLSSSLIETVSGSVQLEGGSVDAQITSTSGDFVVRCTEVKNIKITSVSGDILITESTVSDNTKAYFSTTSGDIIVERIEGQWSLVDAASRSGDVSLEWNGESEDTGSKTSVLKSGTEGAVFKAESVSGDIQFN